MNELPVFISYRQEDGTDLAQWLHKSLHGRTLLVTSASLDLPATLSVYIDRGAAAVADWQKLQLEELKRARALLVICSPGAKYEFTDNDWVYREIRWWLENRSMIAPILVTHVESRWVPDIIHERWPNAQLVKVDLKTWSTSMNSEQDYLFERSIQSILRGISASLPNGYKLAIESGMTNVPGLFTWEKDAQFRYIRCNDNYARAAGFDSPHAMLGKTDDEMPWRTLADFFRSGDYQVISGMGPPRMHVQEKEIMVDRVADILVTESQLLDRSGKCVGVTGYFTDITGHRLVPRSVSKIEDEKGLYLGKEFGDQYLSQDEVEVLRGMLKVHSAERIAGALNLGRGAVESHIQSIKLKLQCITDGDVIAVAIRSGLPLTLFGPEKVS